MIIRKMTELDLEQVCLIEQESFSDPWSKGTFVNSLSNANEIYIVAEEDNVILGYCGMWNIVGEGNITNVAVKSDYRGKKIGKALVTRLLELGEELGVYDFTLEVRVGNKSAIALYEKLGFEQAGVRKNYYVMPTEDAIIMWYHKIRTDENNGMKLHDFPL